MKLLLLILAVAAHGNYVESSTVYDSLTKAIGILESIKKEANRAVTRLKQSVPNTDLEMMLEKTCPWRDSEKPRADLSSYIYEIVLRDILGGSNKIAEGLYLNFIKNRLVIYQDCDTHKEANNTNKVINMVKKILRFFETLQASTRKHIETFNSKSIRRVIGEQADFLCKLW